MGVGGKKHVRCDSSGDAGQGVLLGTGQTFARHKVDLLKVVDELSSGCNMTIQFVNMGDMCFVRLSVLTRLPGGDNARIGRSRSRALPCEKQG
jgi:hypothetical protein